MFADYPLDDKQAKKILNFRLVIFSHSVDTMKNTIIKKSLIELGTMCTQSMDLSKILCVKKLVSCSHETIGGNKWRTNILQCRVSTEEVKNGMTFFQFRFQLVTLL